MGKVVLILMALCAFAAEKDIVAQAKVMPKDGSVYQENPVPVRDATTTKSHPPLLTIDDKCCLEPTLKMKECCDVPSPITDENIAECVSEISRAMSGGKPKDLPVIFGGNTNNKGEKQNRWKRLAKPEKDDHGIAEDMNKKQMESSERKMGPYKNTTFVYGEVINCVFRKKGLYTSIGLIDKTKVMAAFVANVNNVWKPVMKAAVEYCYPYKSNGGGPPPPVFAASELLSCVHKYLAKNCPASAAKKPRHVRCDNKSKLATCDQLYIFECSLKSPFDLDFIESLNGEMGTKFNHSQAWLSVVGDSSANQESVAKRRRPINWWWVLELVNTIITIILETRNNG